MKSKILRIVYAIVFFAIVNGKALSSTAPLPVIEKVAVVFDKDENYSEFIDGIDGTPNVAVFRITLQPGISRLFTAPVANSNLLAFNGDGGIAVVYPNLGEPYFSMFSEIIGGIENKSQARVTRFPIGDNQSPAELESELRRHGIHAVISLGRNGFKAVNGLDRDTPVVVGGVISAPEAETRGRTVHSLAPDPFLLFEQLKTLMPGVRRVFVVYEPNQNAWLIRLAREAAKNRGLELVAKEVPDRKTAMLIYQEIMSSADSHTDALWLPQDSVTVDESLVMPMVLKESWNRNIVVFSSNLQHAERGVLFSLFPDNKQLGRLLAASALNQPSAGMHPSGSTTIPLRNVLSAVNVRTASHLGLDIRALLSGFKLVFPEQ